MGRKARAARTVLTQTRPLASHPGLPWSSWSSLCGRTAGYHVLLGLTGLSLVRLLDQTKTRADFSGRVTILATMTIWHSSGGPSSEITQIGVINALFPGPLLGEAINPGQRVQVKVDAHSEELLPALAGKTPRRGDLPIALGVD
jgi:hypothetical protein